jgi:hypothetical protein
MIEIPNDPNWLQLIPRSEFPGSILDPNLGKELALPVVNGIFVHHSVTNFTGNWHNDLNEVIRAGLGRFGHLSYKYLYHRTHRIFIQGQGPRRSADTSGYNSTSISISVIGNTHMPYTAVTPILFDDEDARRIGRFCNWLRAAEIVTPDCPIRPHQAVKATACPGSGVMAKWSVIEQTAADSEGIGAWKRIEAPTPPPPPPPPPPVEPAPTDTSGFEELRADLLLVAERVDAMAGRINGNTDSVLETSMKLMELRTLVEAQEAPPSIGELIAEISRRLDPS